MKALIIGAGGQDGPYLGQYLADLGYEVFGAIHPLENHYLAQLRAPDMKLVPFDVMEPTAYIPLITDYMPDEVYYLAGVSSAAGAEASPVAAIQTNYLGLIYLFEALSRYNTYAKVLYASSCFIFGDWPPPQSEITPLIPHNLYSLSKANGHQYIQVQRRRKDFYTCNAILFNHESIWRPASYLTRKVSCAAATKTQISLGNLEATRDWGWAGDHIRAMHLLLQQEGRGLDACIGTGTGSTVEEWLDACFGYVGVDWRSAQPPLVAHLNGSVWRPSDHFIADPSLVNGLGWLPSVNLSTLAKMMVEADIERKRGFNTEMMVEYERATWPLHR